MSVCNGNILTIIVSVLYQAYMFCGYIIEEHLTLNTISSINYVQQYITDRYFVTRGVVECCEIFNKSTPILLNYFWHM